MTFIAAFAGIGAMWLWPVVFAAALLGVVTVASLVAAGARDDGLGPLPERQGYAYVAVPVSVSVDGGPRKQRYVASVWEDGFLIDVSDRVDRLMMPTWFFGVGSAIRLGRRQPDSLTVEYLRNGQRRKVELGGQDLPPLLAGLDGIGFDTTGTVTPADMPSMVAPDASPPVIRKILNTRTWFGVLGLLGAVVVAFLVLTGTVYGYLLAGYLAISWMFVAMKWRPRGRR